MKSSSLPNSLTPEGNLASTGHDGLDSLMDKMRLGDNVVWHVDEMDDYREFVRLWLERAEQEQRRVIYLRFSDRNPVVLPKFEFVEWVKLDASEGFDSFSQKVNLLAEQEGQGVYYVFDCLSDLVKPWATEELMVNFFQTACPYLFQLRTIAWFALLRRRHTNQAIARIYNTTQVFIEFFRANGERYLKLGKVWDRYSTEMFFPHRIEGNRLQPLLDRILAPDTPEDPHAQRSPWDSLQQRLRGTMREAGETSASEEELNALKEEFSRMLLGRHPVFARLADRFLGLDALLKVRERLIGSGRIGGKAVGMLLAREILNDAKVGLEDPSVLEDHDSYFIASDIFYSFLVQNHLFRLRIEQTRNDGPDVGSFADIERRFLEGKFPPDVMSQFRRMLEYYGNAPIIVRSSSLLEDSFGGAFAGKYRSEFCPNQGSIEERLEELCRAIKLVYASCLSPDAISYRRRRNLEESEELMAILVQRVSGTQYRNYFFPTLAGVAFSENLYAWNTRIDPHTGVIRLVFGMGTRAVDRVGGDYPRMISVSHPMLRPEVGVEAAKYSQHEIDVIDLESNTFQTMPVWDVVSDINYPSLHLMVSKWGDDHLEDPYTRFLDPDFNYVLTFNNLLRQTALVKTIGECLGILEETYGQPVDIEFTAHIGPANSIVLNLLQCRPLWTKEDSQSVAVPGNILDADILFCAEKVITGGVVDDIDYIIYIDPDAYDAIDYPPDRKTLGRVVGRLNSQPEIAAHNFILIGPGRWGSSNSDLGVNVSYADIDNTNVLIELASSEYTHAPDVSYGTHFFQDLVEEQIIYLPVYGDQEQAKFNRNFFQSAPNALADYLPNYATMEHCIKLIDLRKMKKSVRLVADPLKQQAVCYFVGD